MESIVGQTISHYAFLEKLGAGGMGEIYKARDSRLNRFVAVKVLAPATTRNPERRRRFIQEAQAASALNHPNIITIHDILPEGDTQYMVMEYVAGQTLHQLIVAGRLPVSQVMQIGLQMANALAAAHSAGIIHRDLKPANVMVTSSGLVKVLDFGLAKLTDPTGRMRSADGSSEDPATMTAAPLTVEGTIMGTLNYMSPEQAEGLKVDARSDIFSFGAVLYEMLTGQRAFDGDSGISTLSAVLRDDVKPIRVVAPDVPSQLDDIVARCLQKNTSERWQSMAEVATALSSLRARLDSGVLQSPAASPAVSGPMPAPVPQSAASASTAAVPSATPKIEVKKPGAKKLVLLGGVCVALLAVAAVAAWWQTYHQKATPQAAAPVATAALPTPQPVPPPAVEPLPEPAAKNDDSAKNVAPEAIPAAPAPPPRTRVVLPRGKATSPAPPPPVATPAPQPQVAATPAAPVAVVPVPRAPAPQEVVPVKLSDGLPFRIALIEDVPIDTEVGQALTFRVLDGLRSGDTVVIAKGSIVTGTVAALGGKRNFFGERSKVRFRLISAESVDDGKIHVRATPATRSDGMETRPFETPNGTKDKNLIAVNGTEYVAYIAGDQTVNVHK